MKKLHRLKSVFPEDAEYIEEVASLVFNSYPGNLQNWNLKDTKKIWKISFGKRSGVLGICVKERQCCIKLFYDDRMRSYIRNAFGFPKALKAYKKALKLASLNIPVPGMLGWAQNKRFGLTLVVSELLMDSVQVDTWLGKNSVIKEFLQKFAIFIRNMHDAGVRHLDLSPRNILVKTDGSRSFYFYLLDYEDTRFYKKLSFQKRLSDLHHLTERMISLLTDDEQRIFLISYLKDNLNEFDKWDEALKRAIMNNPSKYTKQPSRNQNN